MYLEPPWKRKIYKLPEKYALRESENKNYQIKYDIKHFLNEELGSFNEQYDLVDEISDIVIMMYNIGQTEKILNREIMGVKKTIYIILNEMTLSNANISEIRADSFKLEINISRFEKNTLGVEGLKKKLMESIAHELMHGNIIYSRYYNNQKIDDIPIYYSNLMFIYQNDNTIIGDICYALYSTIYHERQAIVSQTVMSLNMLNKNGKLIPQREWKNYIYRCEPYIIYNTVLNTVKELKKIKTIEQKNNILNDLKEKNIIITDFDKMVRKIEDGALKAIKDVTRNAMLYFHNM